MVHTRLLMNLTTLRSSGKTEPHKARPAFRDRLPVNSVHKLHPTKIRIGSSNIDCLPATVTLPKFWELSLMREGTDSAKNS